MSTFSYRCTQCGADYERDEVRYLCPKCGPSYVPGAPLPGVLEAVFDQRKAAAIDPRKPDWSALCCVDRKHYPDFPVGGTPLTRVPRLAERLGLRNLWVKNDGLNPSGSLKDRASHLMVAEAIRVGEPLLVAASTGNAASALAAVCAAAGRQALIFVPKGAPRAKLLQIILAGARVVRVDGVYDDAFRLSLDYTRERGGLNRNTAYHPLTIEGKKTVCFELFEQLGGRAPAAVVVPTGDGVILAAVHKGFQDLQKAGLIDKVPRLICAQAESSDAVHRLVTTGTYTAAKPHTIADSISVSAPSNLWWAARAVKESNGLTVLASDAEILDAQALLLATTGVFAEPAAACGLACLIKVAPDFADEAGDVVLLATGSGLKDIDAPLGRLELPAPVAPTLEAVLKNLSK